MKSMLHRHIIRGDIFCFIADLYLATKKARTSCGLIMSEERGVVSAKIFTPLEHNTLLKFNIG